MYKNGVNNFPELLELAQQTEPSNNPYLTSEVMPDHPLYQALLAKQRNQIVNDLLKPHMDNNDADAMYWYAMDNMAGINGRIESGLWLIQSAKLGNPYAAFYLRERNYDCKLKIAHLCDDKWRERAKELFKESAEKGDIKSRYYYVYGFGKKSSQEDTDELVSVIIDAAKQGYYRPLIDFIDRYSREHGWKDLEDKKKGFDLLKMAANDNYIPAIDKILDMLNDTSFKKNIPEKKIYENLIKKAIALGAHSGVFEKFYLNKEKYDENREEESKLLMNVYDCIEKTVFNNNLFCNELAEEERKVAMKEARLIISKMQSPIYIDELHPDTF